ncbi:restriction endonuclease [Streptomyces sp. ALI-76-A]|uniref:restriction endonuclease n=1 Tax=Streptomyces sp. ALI-76-A TaxID=3025736 RepID=UPI00256F09AC|nr:restriction endonuclease [Streptomyces sp. ALI-76-A]MDL5202342.1 restriction endonuclease [Streptomyces sp. ALI-76-A]
MAESIHFGENPLVPSKAYADAWPAFTREHWKRVLSAYRSKVSALYSDLADQRPDCFELLGPLEIRVIVSLVKEWVFIKPGTEDRIVLDERWEDGQLAHRSMYRRADHERVVREVAGVDDSYKLHLTVEVDQKVAFHSIPDIHSANSEFVGAEQADLDAGSAIRLPGWEDAIAELMGRKIDRSALARLQGQLDVISELKGSGRGNRFEVWLGELLAAHGCEVEPGVTRNGEQIDFFVHKPFRAVIECRWKAKKLQSRELADLTAKLGRRPAVIAGIYVAWSGFTDACRSNAAQEPNGRTVLLWDSSDLKRLLSGEVHAMDLFEEHVSDRVRRYRLDG